MQTLLQLPRCKRVAASLQTSLLIKFTCECRLNTRCEAGWLVLRRFLRALVTCSATNKGTSEQSTTGPGTWLPDRGLGSPIGNATTPRIARDCP